jgi:hypothetical protein
MTASQRILICKLCYGGDNEWCVNAILKLMGGIGTPDHDRQMAFLHRWSATNTGFTV